MRLPRYTTEVAHHLHEDCLIQTLRLTPWGRLALTVEIAALQLWDRLRGWVIAARWLAGR